MYTYLIFFYILNLFIQVPNRDKDKHHKVKSPEVLIQNRSVFLDMHFDYLKNIAIFFVYI